MSWNQLLLKLLTLKNQILLLGVIYRHPSMDPTDLNNNYLNKLLEIISREQKSEILILIF